MAFYNSDLWLMLRNNIRKLYRKRTALQVCLWKGVDDNMRWVWCCGLGLLHSGQGPLAGSCQHGYEFMFHKCREFDTFLKKDISPCSLVVTVLYSQLEALLSHIRFRCDTLFFGPIYFHIISVKNIKYSNKCVIEETLRYYRTKIPPSAPSYLKEKRCLNS
jgi:hypothetical protein